jgi:hypothetical protein
MGAFFVLLLRANLRQSYEHEDNSNRHSTGA